MSIGERELREIFVERTGLLGVEEFERVVGSAQELRRPLDHLLMERSFVSPRYYLQLLGDYLGAPVTELKVGTIDPGALGLIPEPMAQEHLVIGFARDADTLRVAMTDPRNEGLKRRLAITSKMRIEPYVATERAIRRALLLYQGDLREVLDQALLPAARPLAARRTRPKETASPTAFVDALVRLAELIEASDIHIEPYEDGTLVRLRVDGLLRTVASFPRESHPALIARLKVLSNLRIDEKRIPQDGRFSAEAGGQGIDFRISTVPSTWGEKAVLRVLRKDAGLIDLVGLGLLESDLALVRRTIRRPYGMILVCGPTGSGKSTTLYAFLQEIGLERIDVINISTVEDPVEYSVPRITQISIQPEIDLTFAAGLRALLRQDPDILMVGEIRDRETADIAVRCSLTGRLLFSSLHTNDAIGAIPRLLDMGIEPFLISSTLTLVIAQRLIRKLCTKCRQSYEPGEETFALLARLRSYEAAIAVLQRTGVLPAGAAPLRGVRFFRATGCSQCDGTGYGGRTGVFEILEIDDTLRVGIRDRTDAASLFEAAIQSGMKSLAADGLAKVILGITDLEEVLRTTV